MVAEGRVRILAIWGRRTGGRLGRRPANLAPLDRLRLLAAQSLLMPFPLAVVAIPQVAEGLRRTIQVGVLRTNR
jgi:hypothetical protein